MAMGLKEAMMKAADAAESVERRIREEETMEEEANKIRKEEEDNAILERPWWNMQAGAVTDDEFELQRYESETKTKRSRASESETSSDDNGDSEVKFQRSVMKACGDAGLLRREKESEEEQILIYLAIEEETEREQAQVAAYEFERATERKKLRARQ